MTGSPDRSAPEQCTDEQLCQVIREGAAWPLEMLWLRHVAIASAWANKKDPAAAEDVVAEGFALVFQALIDGGGPTESFRGYLYRTMDSLFVKHWRAQRRTSRLEDFDGLSVDETGTDSDSLSDRQEQHAAAAALMELPERWRDVIIAVDVEGRPVQKVAQDMGLTPNSTSVLLKRAREGLRKSWMQHLHRPSTTLPDDCSSAVKHFGTMRWGKKGTRRRTATERHLETCSACRARYVQFLEQAVSVGLGLAGLLALTRGWREKLVPALATSAVVVASFSVTVPLDRTPAQPPPTESSETDSSTSPTGSGTGEPRTAGDIGDTEDVRADDPQEEAEEASSGDGEDAPEDAAESPGEAAEDDSEEPVDMLYFGDWTGWDEERESFSGTP